MGDLTSVVGATTGFEFEVGLEAESKIAWLMSRN
jgi:hypothetical protein